MTNINTDEHELPKPFLEFIPVFQSVITHINTWHILLVKITANYLYQLSFHFTNLLAITCLDGFEKIQSSLINSFMCYHTNYGMFFSRFVGKTVIIPKENVSLVLEL